MAQQMISPVFEQLAQSEAKPGKLAFVKVNVDNQQDIARQYGVSAYVSLLLGCARQSIWLTS